MTLDIAFIHGVAIGFEFVEALPEEEIPPSIIIDILILRFLIQW